MTLRVLVVDVDDTLHPWVPVWRAIFDATLRWISDRVDADRADVLAAIRAFNQSAGTSEAFPTQADLTKFGLASEHQDLVAELARVRAVHTRPFADVHDTLFRVQALGISIVAHTDTPPAIAANRMRELKLEGLVCDLFSTATDRTRADLRNADEVRAINHHVLAQAKPDARALEQLLGVLRAKPEDCIYIGDSLMKDVRMARAVGMRCVHAEYGCQRDTASYELLREVSHWTQQDIEAERALLRQPHVEADWSLREGLHELLQSPYFPVP